MTTQLTPNFSLEEFLASDTAAEMGIDNSADADVVINLTRVAQVMEQVRHLLNDSAITITSGYRCPELNAVIGGSTSSAHLYGLACDFVSPAYGTPEAICEMIEGYVDILGIDQLIHEYDSWVHMGLCFGTPRGQCLTIDDNGTESGFS